MKTLGLFNLFGVLALAVLCVFQWRINRDVNLQAISLDRTRQEQAQKLADQDRTIKGYIADLDDFRRRLEQSDAALREAEGKVAALTTERDRLTLERDAAVSARDQLRAEFEKERATLEKWIAAEKQSEDAIKKTNEEIQKLAAQRDANVEKYNELAGKYNGVVKDLNDARAKLAARN